MYSKDIIFHEELHDDSPSSFPFPGRTWHSGLTAATCIWRGCKLMPSPRSCFCKHVWIVVLLCLVLSKPCFSWSLASSWWQGSVCGFACTMCPQLTPRLQPLAMRLPLWAPGAISIFPAARQDFSFQRIEKAPGVSQLQGIWWCYHNIKALELSDSRKFHLLGILKILNVWV